MTREEIQVIVSGRNGLSPVLRGASRGVETFANDTIGHFRRVSSSIVNLPNLVAGAVAGMTARAVVTPAIDREGFVAQFEKLLGDTEEAVGRVEEYIRFSDLTPFEPDEIVRAGAVLQVLAGDALATGAGFEMVGNAAAVSRQRIDELAQWFGRLYDGIQSGRPVGEALMRLTELGILSGKVRTRIEDLQKTNADSATVWGVVTDAMRRHDGMMARMSETTAGRLSTLRGKWKNALGDVGEELLPVVNQMVDDLIGEIDRLRADGSLERWGKDAAAVVETIYRQVRELTEWVASHQDLLKTLGMGYVAARMALGLANAVATVRLALGSYARSQIAAATATDATTAAMARQRAQAQLLAMQNWSGGIHKASGATAAYATQVGTLAGQVKAVGGTLNAVGLAGVTAFAGWNVGKIIGDVTGLHEALSSLLADLSTDEADASDNSALAAETWARKHGGSMKGFRDWQRHQEARRRGEEGRKPNRTKGPGRRGGSTWDPRGPSAANVEQSRFEKLSAALEKLRRQTLVAAQTGEEATERFWTSLTGMAEAPNRALNTLEKSSIFTRLAEMAEGDVDIALKILERRHGQMIDAEEELARKRQEMISDLAALEARARKEAADRRIQATLDAADREAAAMRQAADRKHAALLEAENRLNRIRNPKEKDPDEERERRRRNRRAQHAAERLQAGRHVTKQGMAALREVRAEKLVAKRRREAEKADRDAERAARAARDRREQIAKMRDRVEAMQLSRQMAALRRGLARPHSMPGVAGPGLPGAPEMPPAPAVPNAPGNGPAGGVPALVNEARTANATLKSILAELEDGGPV